MIFRDVIMVEEIIPLEIVRLKLSSFRLDRERSSGKNYLPKWCSSLPSYCCFLTILLRKCLLSLLVSFSLLVQERYL